MPVPLPSGLPPIPRGLPLTPEANLLPDNPEELRCRCCIGEEKVPSDDVDALRTLRAEDGVLRETDRGESDRPGVIRGDRRVPDGEGLYRGGVIVSFAFLAMGVTSTSLD